MSGLPGAAVCCAAAVPWLIIMGEITDVQGEQRPEVAVLTLANLDLMAVRPSINGTALDVSVALPAPQGAAARAGGRAARPEGMSGGA